MAWLINMVRVRALMSSIPMLTSRFFENEFNTLNAESQVELQQWSPHVIDLWISRSIGRSLRHRHSSLFKWSESRP